MVSCALVHCIHNYEIAAEIIKKLQHHKELNMEFSTNLVQLIVENDTATILIRHRIFYWLHSR